MSTRVKQTAEFKAMVALEALRGERTIRELAAIHGVSRRQVTAWKRHAEQRLALAFDSGQSLAAKRDEQRREALATQVAQLKLELAWLKEKLPYNVIHKRLLIDWDNPRVSVARQYTLLGLSRSSRR